VYEDRLVGDLCLKASLRSDPALARPFVQYEQPQSGVDFRFSADGVHDWKLEMRLRRISSSQRLSQRRLPSRSPSATRPEARSKDGTRGGDSSKVERTRKLTIFDASRPH